MTAAHRTGDAAANVVAQIMSDRLLIARDYQSLRHALNERRLALKMTMLDVDAKTGWPDGYASKIFCGNRNLGADSLAWILQAFGVALVVIELPSAGQPLPIKAIKRDAFLQRRMSELASRGGKARRASMTVDQWAELARKGGRAAAAKRAKKRAMTELGRAGGNRTQQQRRARVAEAAESESFPQGI
jgi:transcriptional regulator with XRE-family HTH domain